MTTEPNPAAQALAQGESYMNADPPDHAQAEKLFRKALMLEDDLQRARYLLGDALEALGQHDEAEKHWEEAAIRRDPKLSPPLISLGFRRLRQFQYEEAIELLKRAVELQPHYAHADAKLFLAQAYETAGRIREARAVWHDVLGMEPMYPSYNQPMKEAEKKLREYAGCQG